MGFVFKTLFVIGLQGTVRGGTRCRYQRLRGGGEKAMKMRRKTDGRQPPFHRRLNRRGFSLILLLKRLSNLYSQMVAAITSLDGVHPTIVFSSQWGLPVLSHHPSSASCRRSAVSALHRSLSFS
ncbi:unnamed protein product [Spirodela intermedia]|uniref:Uncharacterized protein n=1 Tax=Spirodela intermedia TaxID=51605 RepID=A0A7I8KQR6_SPIIN|nr:unnamed protein product [Spirodela intermedia]